MAENIGSLEVDISINKIDTEKVTAELIKELKNVENATNNVSKSFENTSTATEQSGKEIIDAVSGVSKKITEVENTVKNAVSKIDDLANSLKEISTTSQATASGIESVNKELTDTAAEKYEKNLVDLTNAAVTANNELTETAQNTEKITNAVDVADDATEEFVQKLSDLAEQMLVLVKNGEEESAEFKKISKDIRGLITEYEKIASEPVFTAQETAELKKYTDELARLVDEQEKLSQNGQKNSAQYKELTEKITATKESISKLTTASKENAAATKTQGTWLYKLANFLGFSIPQNATIASLAVKAFQTALSAGLLLVIQLVVEAAMKLIEKLTFSLMLQSKLNEKVADSTTETIGQLKLLQTQWNSLGNDLKEKEKFIDDNKDAFAKLGVSVNSVGDAENLLVQNTDKFVAAMTARARATAARELMQDQMKDDILDLVKLENDYIEAQEELKNAQQNLFEGKIKFELEGGEIVDNRRGIPKAIQRLILGADLAQNALNKIEEKIKKTEGKINKGAQAFNNIIVKSNNEADKALQAAGITVSEELTKFKNTLSDKKTAYEQYAKDLNSTDKEIRENAAKTNNIDKKEGKNYLEFLTRLREQYRGKKDELNLINAEISKITQKSSKSGNTSAIAEELTEYEKLKLAAQEYVILRNKGYDPTIFKKEEEAIKKQIEEYEIRNHLVEPPKTDYTQKLSQYQAFAEKLVNISEKARQDIDKVNENKDLTDEEKQTMITNIEQLKEGDIALLKEEYGYVGEDLAAEVLNGLNETLNEAAPDIAQKIVEIKNQITTAQNQGKEGNDTSQEIAKLQAQLQVLITQYEKLRKTQGLSEKEQEKINKEIKKNNYAKLEKAITDCADGFKSLGSQIGGAGGEALTFLGNLTTTIMSTITAIQTYASGSVKALKEAGVAAAGAIRAVETASVILAVIEAAMQVAMALINMFKKDEETYEDKKNVYSAYINVLDTIIGREKELAETLADQQAAAQYDAIGVNLEKQEQATRRIAKDYLASRKRGEHSKGYYTKERLNSSDWQEIRAAGLNNVRGVYDIFDLSVEQLKRLQEEASGFYSKLDSETREHIEKIIEVGDRAANLQYEKWETINGISFDSFKDNFVDSLKDMDATAEDIAKNIKDQMRQGLIDNMFKKQFQDKLDDYYQMWGKMAEDGIDDEEQKYLESVADNIANQAAAAAEKINEKFRTVEEELEEEGLSGAIKNASQESIDLLTGQTNAVRVNQVVAMDIAREQIATVMQINLNLISCMNYLNSIDTSVKNGNGLRSQGIMDY